MEFTLMLVELFIDALLLDVCLQCLHQHLSDAYMPDVTALGKAHVKYSKN